MNRSTSPTTPHLSAARTRTGSFAPDFEASSSAGTSYDSAIILNMSSAKTMEPVTPRPASTLILVRDGPEAPEVLLMERGAGARFMPGAYVFAGGAVDPGDASPEAYGLSPWLSD